VHSNTQQNGGTVQSPDASDTLRDPFPSLRDIAGSLIFYLGIPIATLYPTEAGIFMVQIMSFYGHSYWTAAYAVSLVPSSVMVIWAVNDLLINVFEGIVGILPVILLTAVWTAKGWHVVWGAGWRNTPLRRLAVLSILVIYIGGALLLATLGVLAPRLDILVRMRTAIASIIWVLGAIASGYIIGTDFRKSRRGEVKLATRVHARRWLARGVLFAYLFNACLLIGYLGTTSAPALPKVDFDEDKRRDGLLLGLSDGYWHILDNEGNIVAIPTDRVRAVTVRHPDFK